MLVNSSVSSTGTYRGFIHVGQHSGDGFQQENNKQETGKLKQQQDSLTTQVQVHVYYIMSINA